MNALDINFSKLFYEKHGKDIFENITKDIKSEYNSNCDKTYIDIIFSVAFLTYFGITDNRRLALMLGASKDKSTDIENIRRMHKKSIFKIQKYIKSNNNKIKKN